MQTPVTPHQEALVPPRSRPLEELDDTRGGFNWRQIKTLLISSSGFFTDSYDIFIINLVTPMLGYVYYKDNGNQMPSDVQGPFKGMVSFGQLVGQLAFGFLGDAYGRKAVYGLELILIIIATINCATAASAVVGVGAVGFLGFWRLILGIGIGGDYPLSSTVASEWASTDNRGRMISTIFAMQGVGQVTSALVTMIVLAIFKGAIYANVDNLEYVWRICIGLGAVPAIATVYGRLTMPESPRYSVNVRNDNEGAKEALEATGGFHRQRKIDSDDVQLQTFNSTDEEKDNGPPPALDAIDSLNSNGDATSSGNIIQDNEDLVVKTQKDVRRENIQDFYDHFRQWKNLKVLLGVSLCWFLMDIAFYGTNLNQSVIISSMGFAPADADPWHTLWMVSLGNLILAGLGAFPGYIVSVLLIDKIGRKPIQYLGFIVVGVLFIVLGAGWHAIQATSIVLFVVLFALVQFFFNFGPNVTTFVLPAEVFPTRHRAKAHGIAAASGKLGAIISTFGFNSLADVGGAPGKRAFLPYVLIIFGGLMLVCVYFTRWVPETKRRPLDDFEQ